MSLSRDVYYATQNRTPLILDLDNYRDEASDGVLLQTAAWTLNKLPAVSIVGHGYYTVKFELPPNSSYAISLIGVQNVHFDGWYLHIPSSVAIAVMGARAPDAAGSPGVSLNHWRMNGFRFSVKSEIAGMWLNGVEDDVHVACDYANVREPIDAARPAHTVWYGIENHHNVPGAGVIWHADKAASCVSHDYYGCQVSHYSGGSCFGLQDYVRAFNWHDGCIGSHSGPFMRVVGEKCRDIRIDGANLELADGAERDYAIILEKACVNFKLTDGHVGARKAGVRCLSGGVKQFSPATLSAPTKIIYG